MIPTQMVYTLNPKSVHEVLGLCTLTGSYTPHRAASTSDMFLIYKFEFPTFNKTKNKR